MVPRGCSWGLSESIRQLFGKERRLVGWRGLWTVVAFKPLLASVQTTPGPCRPLRCTPTPLIIDVLLGLLLRCHRCSPCQPSKGARFTCICADPLNTLSLLNWCKIEAWHFRCPHQSMGQLSVPSFHGWLKSVYDIISSIMLTAFYYLQANDEFCTQ